MMRPLNEVSHALPRRMRLGPQFQVLRAVVGSVTVDVMYGFFFTQRPIEDATHNQSVFGHVSIRISHWIRGVTHEPVALLRYEFVSVFVAFVWSAVVHARRMTLPEAQWIASILTALAAGLRRKRRALTATALAITGRMYPVLRRRDGVIHAVSTMADDESFDASASAWQRRAASACTQLRRAAFTGAGEWLAKCAWQ